MKSTSRFQLLGGEVDKEVDPSITADSDKSSDLSSTPPTSVSEVEGAEIPTSHVDSNPVTAREDEDEDSSWTLVEKKKKTERKIPGALSNSDNSTISDDQGDSSRDVAASKPTDFPEADCSFTTSRITTGVSAEDSCHATVSWSADALQDHATIAPPIHTTFNEFLHSISSVEPLASETSTRRAIIFVAHDLGNSRSGDVAEFRKMGVDLDNLSTAIYDTQKWAQELGIVHPKQTRDKIRKFYPLS